MNQNSNKSLKSIIDVTQTPGKYVLCRMLNLKSTVFHLCHYTYMWKTNWTFLGLPFRNGAWISKWSFNFKMELRFQNRASISKWNFDLEMDLRFRNGASIWKWSFDFEMELRFQNQASISKWSFDFEMALRFRNGASISKSSFNCNLKVFHVTFCIEKRHVIWVHVFLHLFIFRFLSWPKQFTSWPERRKEWKMVKWNDK